MYKDMLMFNNILVKEICKFFYNHLAWLFIISGKTAGDIDLKVSCMSEV